MMDAAADLHGQLKAEVPILDWEVLLYNNFSEPGFEVGLRANVNGKKFALTGRFDDHLLQPRDANDVRFIVNQMLGLLMTAIWKAS